MSADVMPDGACTVPPDMTIALAAENHARLLAALPALVADSRLDMGGVTDFDSSGVQLLLALRASLAAEGRTLQIVQPSAVVRDALEVFGLSQTLATAA